MARTAAPLSRLMALPDPRNSLGNLIRLGTIKSVDLGEATCRVEIGEIVTGDLPWITPRAGAFRIWSPPSIGEQCLLFCPEADPEAGIVLLGVFSDANPPPSQDPIILISCADGAIFSYDPAAHLLKIDLPGSAELIAPDGLSITGDVSINGNVTLTGTLDAEGKIESSVDVVGEGKSLKGHKHTGVTAGGGVSGAPQ